MKLYFAGIGGTLMGSLAILARELGHAVSGCDEQIYPPMSEFLAEAGIHVMSGYESSHVDAALDCIVIGNALSRGNPLVEAVLSRGLPYISGPQFLAEHVLRDRWVLAVAGTHGKTTTTSMLAWILEYAGLAPGFLIGGVAKNFPLSACLGKGQYFVIEADEYDTAFFDKRSKFIHYQPRTLIMNNLEYDHADIFPNIEAIKTQFHHLVRTVPANGLIIIPEEDVALQSVIEKGCWTSVVRFGVRQGEWRVDDVSEDGCSFSIYHGSQCLTHVEWTTLGVHNIHNALAAVIAANNVGVSPEVSAEALQHFSGVKRRLELIACVKGVSVYDDFAHHPSAISASLEALRAKWGKQKIIAICDFASNTMRAGVHAEKIAEAFRAADEVILARPPKAQWCIEDILENFSQAVYVCDDIDTIIETACKLVKPDSHIVIMSNGRFGGVHRRLIERQMKSKH